MPLSSESEAAAQAQENINQSPWAERINVHTADIQQWITQQTVRFDLIISNPPYYQQGVECATPQREQARYTTTLDHPSLLTCAAECITEEGFFCVVLPEQIGNGFTELALAWAGIYVCGRMWRKTKRDCRIGCCWHSPRRRENALAIA